MKSQYMTRLAGATCALLFNKEETLRLGRFVGFISDCYFFLDTAFYGESESDVSDLHERAARFIMAVNWRSTTPFVIGEVPDICPTFSEPIKLIRVIRDRGDEHYVRWQVASELIRGYYDANGVTYNPVDPYNFGERLVEHVKAAAESARQKGTNANS